MQNLYRLPQKALFVVTLFLSTMTTMAQGVLDLSSNNYRDGSLQQVFSALGKPPVNVTVTVEGLTTRLVNGTPRNDPRGLWLSLDLGGRVNDKVTVTFAFSEPVTNLVFGIRGIDRELAFSNYQDRVAIEGFDALNKRVAPSIGYNPRFARITDGDSAGIKVASGIAEDQYDSTLVSVSYAGFGIKKIKLTYGSGTAIRPDLATLQNIFITPFSWANIVPVRLMYFKGKSLSNKVLLDWATASEVNSDFFTVQRSNNLTEFADLGKLKSAGDSKTQLAYNFIDEAPLPGVNYYRLKQTDKDGTTDFSKIIAVNSTSDVPRFVLYPNPSNGRSVQLQFDNLDLSGLRLVDILGRDVPFELQSNTANGLTIKPITALTTGLYFVAYRTFGQATVTQKLMVQE